MRRKCRGVACHRLPQQVPAPLRGSTRAGAPQMRALVHTPCPPLLVRGGSSASGRRLLEEGLRLALAHAAGGPA